MRTDQAEDDWRYFAHVGEVGICARFLLHITYGLLYRGKGLGGSSGINFLCWIKPPAEDIDGMSPATGRNIPLCSPACAKISNVLATQVGTGTILRSTSNVRKGEEHISLISNIVPETTLRFVPPSEDVQLRKGLKFDTWNMGTEGEQIWTATNAVYRSNSRRPPLHRLSGDN